MFLFYITKQKMIKKEKEYIMIIETDCKDINYTYTHIHFSHDILNLAYEIKSILLDIYGMKCINDRYRIADLSKEKIDVINLLWNNNIEKIKTFLYNVWVPAYSGYYNDVENIYDHLFSSWAFGNDIPYSLEEIMICKCIN